MTVRGHQLAIDWSGQGTFTGPVEDVSSYVLGRDVEISWGRSLDGDVTLATTAGTLTAELNNDSRVFSQENVSSPIAANVLPGRKVQYQVTHQATTYTLMTGQLEDLDDEGDPVAVFPITVLDAWGRPGAEKLSTPLYRGLRTGDAINLVLDAIGWTGPRQIDPGATMIAWWWVEGDDAATAINQLVHSEGTPAIAYVRGSTFVFRDRHHRIIDTRCQTSQGTYTHRIPATGPVGDFKIEAGTFSYNNGLKRIANSANFAVDVRAQALFGEVWATEDTLTVAAGATTVMTVQATDPFLNAVTPEVGVDILIQAGAVSAVTLSRTSGRTAVIAITCPSETVITRVALRGNAVPVVRRVQVTARDNGSIGRFGTREWPSEAAPVWAGVNDAQVIATKSVTVYGSYRPVLTFTVVGLDATYLAEILDARISDRITVRNDKRGINGDFAIERLSHRITKLGLIHRLTITAQAVEPTQPANVFTFNVAGKGFNDGLFGVDGIDSAANVFVFDSAGHGFDQGLFAN